MFCQRQLYPRRVKPEDTCISCVQSNSTTFFLLWCSLWYPCDVGDILTRLQQTGWVGDGLWLLAQGTRSLVCFFSWCTVSCQMRYLRALFASSLHPHDLSVLIWVQLCDRYKTCTQVLTNTFIPQHKCIYFIFPKALNIDQTYITWFIDAL